MEQGAFAEVFNLGNGTVLKAFFDTIPAGGSETQSSFVPRIVFAAERRVYQALRELQQLEPFTPKFFGEADPRSFPIDSQKRYGSGCGLVLERIPGDAQKLCDLPPNVLRRAEHVIEEMRGRVGLGDPWDASCFVPGTRREFTLIDFATPTNQLVALDQLIAKHGHVPDNCKAILGLV